MPAGASRASNPQQGRHGRRSLPCAQGKATGSAWVNTASASPFGIDGKTWEAPGLYGGSWVRGGGLIAG